MQKAFARSYSALASITSFIDAFLRREALAESVRFPLQFAVEEIFTNLVKYNPEATAAIRIEACRTSNGICIEIHDEEAAPFDIDTAPVPDTKAALSERAIGGLGLHVSKKLLDDLEYEYEDGTTTIRLIKNLE